MYSLHDVHEMNAYRAGHACLPIHPSVHTVKLENHVRDLDEIWYEHFAIGDYPKIIISIFCNWQ
jgi:hypothetical protein